MTWPPYGRTRREHADAEFDAAEEWEQSRTSSLFKCPLCKGSFYNDDQRARHFAGGCRDWGALIDELRRAQ